MNFYVHTEQGRVRSMNQDYVFSTDHHVGSLPNLFLVADGMGGQNAGEFASEYTVKTILDEIRHHKELEPIATLEKAITHANKIIFDEAVQNADKTGMGTTLVAATFVDGHLYVANVGDSRLYVNTPDELKQITRDHSVVEELVREGTVSKKEARNHPKKNMITRAVGAESTVRADFFDVMLDETDQVLMCTDGLTNMVEDEDIHAILNGPEDLKTKVKTLAEIANQNGGRDNITILVVEPFAEEDI